MTSPPEAAPEHVVGTSPRRYSLAIHGTNARLRIYMGEDKRHGDKPLFEAIVYKARQFQMAGATVVHGTLGYGRSTRMHTTDVVFSEDLPVIVEIVDSRDKIKEFIPLLAGINEIGLMTCDDVSVLLYPPPPVTK